MKWARRRRAIAYDYTDVRVPVLRAMHARRLATYRTLGQQRQLARRLSIPAVGSYTWFMTVTVDLLEDAFARLRAEAKRRGVSIDLVIAELTSVLPPDPLPGKPTLSFIGLGSSASARFARDTDELLADGFGRN